jgi:hypothetical protein
MTDINTNTVSETARVEYTETPDLLEREEAARLLTAYRDAIDAQRNDEYPPDVQARLDVIQAEYEKARIAVLAGYRRELHAGIEAAIAKTMNAYMSHPMAMLEDDEGRPVRCAKSNIPILVDDEVVEDSETGETYLRSALGLPLRAIEEDDADEDSEFEDA